LNSTGPDIISRTICDRYSALLNINNFQLLTVIVNQTIVGLVTNATTAPYFTGQIPAGSTDYRANAAALAELTKDLIEFFGGALGCNDATIPRYVDPGLGPIHQPLRIPQNVFDAFNQILVGVCATNGVNSTDLATILMVLNSLQGVIVFNPNMVPSMTPAMMSGSVCDRYSAILRANDHDVVYAIVNRTVYKVVANPVTVPFFNGQRPANAVNFLIDPVAVANLIEQLVQFFGQALGCTDGTIAPFSGRNMLNVHRNMGLTLNEFNTFNNLVLLSMKEYGVTQTDLALVMTVLQGLENDIVPKYKFIQDDYVPNGLTGGAIVAIVISAIIIAILIAAFCVGLTLGEKKLHCF